MSSLSLNNSRHIAGLDGLRGIAILSVLVYHLFFYFFADYLPLVAGGFLGVDLFFVLSGFLITYLSLQEFETRQSLHIGKFYLRRVLRLIPALAVFLLVMVIVFAITGELQGSGRFFFSVLFYFHNWMVYFTLQTPEVFGHLWSLSIEEQFYIFWPFVLLVILRLLPSKVTMIVLLLIVCGVAFLRFKLWEGVDSWLQLYLRTDMRIDGFCAGALTAFLWRYQRIDLLVSAPLVRLAALLGYLLMIYLFDASQGFYYQYGALMLNGLAVLWIMTCFQQESAQQSWLEWRWLRYLGTRSYGMYLWHFPVFLYFSQWLNGLPALFAAAIALFMTLLVTEVSFRFVEMPFNRIRKTKAQAEYATVA
ncbi:MAG: acyltransferase, partial [Pseudomonadales bacterium]|nr:acyltransferase [Pseudomonadales bacterium]